MQHGQQHGQHHRQPQQREQQREQQQRRPVRSRLPGDAKLLPKSISSGALDAGWRGDGGGSGGGGCGGGGGGYARLCTSNPLSHSTPKLPSIGLREGGRGGKEGAASLSAASLPGRYLAREGGSHQEREPGDVGEGRRMQRLHETEHHDEEDVKRRAEARKQLEAWDDVSGVSSTRAMS